jgi:N-glycosylase/DNA lyase
MRIAAPDFDLEATLESGQVFGFRREPDGAYAGALRGVPVRIRPVSGVLDVAAGAPLDPALVRDYFDLGRDLGAVYRLLEGEAPLAPLAARLRGLRVIRQDPWEALACFILSANNNVKRIQGIVGRILAAFGGFPAPAALAAAGGKLRALGAGYRAPFLAAAARRVAEDPDGFGALAAEPYEAARERLLDFPGVGDKVADCVLLFGFQKYESFPMDVWVLRAMRRLYWRGRRAPERRVRALARRHFGRWAGYIQQYLYHGARRGLL